MTDYSQIIEMLRVGIVVLIGGGLAYVFLPLLFSERDSPDISVEASRYDTIVSTPSTRFRSNELRQSGKPDQKKLDRHKVIKLAGDNPLKTTLQIKNWLREEKPLN